MLEILKKLTVEFIGTFFLVFTIGATGLLSGDKTLSAIAIGFALMVMVYAGGHISGGHYNPAVSLAVAVRKALPWKDLVPYWVAQILGGVIAGILVSHIAAVSETACPSGGMILANVIIGEFLFTFAICYVVLVTATKKATEGNSYYGLAIGSTVTVGALAVGGSCLGAFNPAVAIAVPFIKGCACCFCCKIVWITVLVNLLAGICAALAFKFVSTEK